MSEVQTTANPLGTDRISKLLRGFAVKCLQSRSSFISRRC